ncbi:MAG: MFS transporter [Curvibacter sp.]|nr:MFS transporter [Curvibacter sp.]
MSHPATALPAAAARAPAHTSAWTVFWLVSIAVFLVSLDSTVLYAAFGTLRQAFPEASAADMSWVLNAYTVVYAAALIPAGGLADAQGRKRVFLIGVALFLAASASCGLSGSVGGLIAARALQAVGAALLTPASLSLVLEAFPKERRAIAVSLWGAVGGLAAAVGPSLGSLVVDGFGWSWAFYLNLPLGLISLWRGVRLLPVVPKKGHTPPIDWVGMALLVASVGLLALAITQADSQAWSLLQKAASAGAGALLLGVFVLWARQARHPLVDLGLFRNPTYSSVNLATLAFGMAFAMMFFAFFSFMTQVWHYSLPQAGVAVTPGPLTVVPTAIVTGRLAARFGHRPFLVGGALIYACSSLWLLLVPGPDPAYLSHWLPGLLLSGLGVGMVLPSLTGAAVSGLPASHYAVGSAVNQATRQIGSVMGVALTVLLIGHSGLVRGDFRPVYATHIALALLTAVLCLRVNTGPRRH